MSNKEVTQINLSQVVANDDGSSANKVAYWGVENGELVIKTDIYKTAIHEGGANLASFSVESSAVFNINGESISIDEHIDGKDVRTDKDYQFSNGTIAMNQYALAKSGFGGKQVYLASGLPVEHYYTGTPELPKDKYKIKKAESFVSPKIFNATDELGNPTSLDRKRLVDVVSSDVYPEGVAAFYDLTVSYKGVQDNNLFKGEIVIIDMGSYTTDICLLGPDGTLRMGYVKTIRDGGFLKIFDNFKKGCVNGNIGVQVDKMPRKVIENALTTGILVTSRKNIDVSGIVENAINISTAEITSTVEFLLGDQLDFVTDIIAIGGGANLIKDHFSSYSNIITVPENPQFSNAIGYLKLATFFSEVDVIDDLT
jgi:hypothetical protein